MLAWVNESIAVAFDFFQLNIDELQVGCHSKERLLCGMCDIAKISSEVQGEDGLVRNVVGDINRAQTVVLHGAVRRKFVDGEVAIERVDVFAVGGHCSMDIVGSHIAFVVNVTVHPKAL